MNLLDDALMTGFTYGDEAKVIGIGEGNIGIITKFVAILLGQIQEGLDDGIKSLQEDYGAIGIALKDTSFERAHIEMLTCRQVVVFYNISNDQINYSH